MFASFSVSPTIAAIIIITLSHSSALNEPQPPTVVITGVIPERSKHDHEDLKEHDHTPVNFGDSVVHLLLEAIRPFRVAHDETNKAKDAASPTVSVIELEKLKTAAKSSGLSGSKANRVRRAVEHLNLGVHDITVLCQVYEDPTTSAEYGDWMRTALEKRCINEVEHRSRATAEASPVPITPDEFQRLKTAAKLSGLKEKELEALGKVMEASKLSKEQLTKLEEAIVHHAPTALDLKKFTEQLSKLRKARDAAEEQDEQEYDWKNPTYGSDWLFKPVTAPSEKTKSSV